MHPISPGGGGSRWPIPFARAVISTAGRRTRPTVAQGVLPEPTVVAVRQTRVRIGAVSVVAVAMLATACVGERPTLARDSAGLPSSTTATTPADWTLLHTQHPGVQDLGQIEVATDDASLRAVWSHFGPDQEPPNVDFTTQVVVVLTVGNNAACNLWLVDMRSVGPTTLVPEFSYEQPGTKFFPSCPPVQTSQTFAVSVTRRAESEFVIFLPARPEANQPSASATIGG
jgi:hypothetical protein